MINQENFIADGIGFLKVFRQEFRLEKQLASPNKYLKSIQCMTLSPSMKILISMTVQRGV